MPKDCGLARDAVEGAVLLVGAVELVVLERAHRVLHGLGVVDRELLLARQGK
jgi:hypothetical protein